MCPICKHQALQDILLCQFIISRFKTIYEKIVQFFTHTLHILLFSILIFDITFINNRTDIAIDSISVSFSLYQIFKISGSYVSATYCVLKVINVHHNFVVIIENVCTLRYFPILSDHFSMNVYKLRHVNIFFYLK